MLENLIIKWSWKKRQTLVHLNIVLKLKTISEKVSYKAFYLFLGDDNNNNLEINK